MGYTNLSKESSRLRRNVEEQQSYQWVQNDGQGYLELPLLRHPGLTHFFGTRLLANVSLEDGHKPIRLRQIHGDRIHPVNEANASILDSGDPTEGDGLITALPNRLIMVSTADCLPVLLFDPVSMAVAALHAGWRGTVSNISGKAVAAMIATYGSDPRDLLVGFGPSIGPCCFEVERDVVEAVETQTAFQEQVIEQKTESKWQLDLVALNRLQLIEAGVLAGRMATTGLCTSCLPNLFFSYRRDRKRDGALQSGIMLV